MRRRRCRRHRLGAVLCFCCSCGAFGNVAQGPASRHELEAALAASALRAPEAPCLQQRWPAGRCNCDCWNHAELHGRLTGIWSRLRHRALGEVRGVKRDLDALFGDESDTLQWLSLLVRVVNGNAESPALLPAGLAAAGVHAGADGGDCVPGWAMTSLYAAWQLWIWSNEAWNTQTDLYETNAWEKIIWSLGYSMVAFGIAVDLVLQCPSCFDGKRWPLRRGEMLYNYAEWIRVTQRADNPRPGVWDANYRWLFRVTRSDSSHRVLQRNAARTSFGRFSDVRCPVEPELRPLRNTSRAAAADAEPSIAPIACVSPALWPFDGAGMLEMASTYMGRCDWCGFYVSAPKDGPPLPASFGPCEIVDLSDEPEVDPDPLTTTQDGNLLPKAAHMLLRANEAIHSGRWSATWVCIVETDLYFIPENLRRLLAVLGLSSKDGHWIGNTGHYSLYEEGLVIEPAGSCLSKSALWYVSATLKRILDHWRTGVGYDPAQVIAWPMPRRWGCEPFRSGNVLRYTTVMNACFRLAGVSPTDPRNVHDLWGRTYFPLLALDNAITFRPRPPPAHCSWFGLLPGDSGNSERSFRQSLFEGSWLYKGKEYLYVACQSQDPAAMRPNAGRRTADKATSAADPTGDEALGAAWVADYPIMFHLHVCGTCVAGAHKTRNLRLWQVHAILYGGAPCKTCGTYRPKVDWSFGRRTRSGTTEAHEPM